MKGKEGDPTGVEKEPTGLARRDIVRRDPCSCSSFISETKKRVGGYNLNRSCAKRRVPARSGGGGEVWEASLGESRMGERGDEGEESLRGLMAPAKR